LETAGGSSDGTRTGVAIERRSGMADRKDLALRELVEKADGDPRLLAKLCADPHAVAAEFGVELAEAEVDQFRRLGTLMNLVSEFTEARIPDPIFYPIDIWWSKTIAKHILFYNPIFYPIRYPIKDWVFYPVPFDRFRMPGLLRRRVQ
jgi:hypothetical protein